MTNKSIFLTGATGFVGSRLAVHLIQSGYDVSILVRENSNLDQLNKIKNKIRIFYYDGTIGSIENSLSSSKPDVIIHLASLFISEHKSNDIKPLISSNITLGCQLLEAMNSTGIKRIVNTGTSWQHFDNQNYNPVNLYAATKQAYESILEFYVRANGLSAITLKIFDTYGPSDPRGKLLTLLKNISDSGNTLSMSPGEQLIDLVHIDDVVIAYVHAIERVISMRTEGHCCYGLSSGRVISLKELVALFSELTGKDIDILWGGREYREREVMVPWESYQPLPGWDPKIELKKGLKDLLQKKNSGV